ncbi:MAG: ATP synthase F1 subunit epsilon [Bacilli bacterium]|nr:ATP synthase F1 subunit epsilon [Bacilli bacterium]
MKLEILLPDKVFFEGIIKEVVLETTEGKIGIFSGHENTSLSLIKGNIKINQDNNIIFINIDEGYATVKKDKVSIFTMSATYGDDEDLEKINTDIRIKESIERKTSKKNHLKVEILISKTMKQLKRIDTFDKNHSL